MIERLRLSGHTLIEVGERLPVREELRDGRHAATAGRRLRCGVVCFGAQLDELVTQIDEFRNKLRVNLLEKLDVCEQLVTKVFHI